MHIPNSKPERCPECSRPYFVRVPKRLDDEINLKRLYRCRSAGYVYLHEIEFGEWVHVGTPNA